MQLTNEQIKNYVNRFSLMEFYSQSDCPTGNNIRYQFFRIYKRSTILELFKKSLKIIGKKDVSVLDIGCGDSSDMNYVVCQLTDTWRNWEIVRNISFHGIDADPQSVSFSTERFKSLGLTAEFKLGDITAPLSYTDKSFDIVICSEVVEHLHEPGILFNEINRVLRVGGCLILTTNNKPSVFTSLKSLLLNKKHSNEEDSRAFDLPGWNVKTLGHINLKPTHYWEKLFKSAGFSILSYGPYKTVQRTGSNSLFGVTVYFLLNCLVSRLPARIGRYFSDTTVLVAQKKID